MHPPWKTSGSREPPDMDPEPTSVEELLDLTEQAARETDRVSIGRILETLGSRSFGPILLLAGLITLAPLLGDIPGVPTIMAAIVVLTAGQLLFSRDHLWLPQWMLARSIRQDRFCRTIGWLRPVARFLDRFSKPRLTMLTRDLGSYAIAMICILVAAVMPLMEMVPFSANIAGVALTAFGLSLTARDGLIALLATIFLVIAFGAGAYHLT